MAWRYRRRLRLLPGVTLNVGKRGASVSLGGRGAHVTYGARGKRATIGLPGSGLSYTAYQPYRHRTAPGVARPPSWGPLIVLLVTIGLIALAVVAG